MNVINSFADSSIESKTTTGLHLIDDYYANFKVVLIWNHFIWSHLMKLRWFYKGLQR